MIESRPAAGVFTGRHMLAIMLGFFAVVIGVNVTLAVVAGSSWTGFVVKNSYVASQEFNEKAAEARAQAALGWTARLEIADGAVRYALADRQGRAVAVTGATIAFRRPAYEAEDETVALVPQPDGALAAAFTPRDGIWIVEVLAQAGLAHPYRDAHRLVVRGGRLQ